MTFKIIQELNKKNRAVLTIIPAGLENNGVYWFPPSHWSTRKLNSVLRNPFATPDVRFWEARPCAVKRNNIATYSLAEEQEEELLNKQLTDFDEDADGESEDSYSGNTKRRTNAARSPQADFSSVVDECLNSLSSNTNQETQKIIQTRESSSPSVEYSIPEATITDVGNTNNYNVEDKTDFVLISGNGTEGYNLDPQPQLQDSISIILGNQEQLFQAISNLSEIVTTGMAKLLSQGEHLGKITTTTVSEEMKQFNIEAAENFKKILTGEQANKLEEQLNDVNFRGQLIRKMAFYIGKNGTRAREGWTCCYELIDLVFHRAFLKLCSWTGASTSNVEEGKIAFCKLKNILMLFATVIRDADPYFSIKETNDFFKQILRNATRFHSQELSQTRKSTKRERGAKKISPEETEKLKNQNNENEGPRDTDGEINPN